MVEVKQKQWIIENTRKRPVHVAGRFNLLGKGEQATVSILPENMTGIKIVKVLNDDNSDKNKKGAK